MSLQVKPTNYYTRSIESLTYSMLCPPGADSVFTPAKALVDFDYTSTSGRHIRIKIQLAGFSMATDTTGDLFTFFQVHEKFHLQVSERTK